MVGGGGMFIGGPTGADGMIVDGGPTGGDGIVVIGFIETDGSES